MIRRFVGIGPGRDLRRLLVQRTADAVAGEIGDQRIAILLRKGTDSVADLRERRAAAHLVQPDP